MTSTPADLESYLAAVQKKVGAALRASLLSRRATLGDINPYMTDQLLNALIQFCTGGKMLRAVLVDLGYQITGGKEHDQALLPIQASVELIHASLLIHDDIIDRSEKRREKDTMHRVFASTHRENGYRGNSDNYGQSIAMLTGDVALCLAFYFALGSQFDTDRKLTAISHFVENLIKTGLGQAMDLSLTVRAEVDRSEIRTMTLYKTAFYTVVAPLQLGGLLGGAGEQTRTLFEGFGRPLGEAYQLQDDILGVFGEEEEIGKSTLSDLKEGKRTLLFQHGLELSSGKDKEHLLNNLGNPAANGEDLRRVRRTLENCGARRIVQEECERLKEIAKDIIPALTTDPRVSSLLDQLCDYIVRRND